MFTSQLRSLFTLKFRFEKNLFVVILSIFCYQTYISFGSSKLVKLVEDRTALDVSFIFELIILYDFRKPQYHKKLINKL